MKQSKSVVRRQSVNHSSTPKAIMTSQLWHCVRNSANASINKADYFVTNFSAG